MISGGFRLGPGGTGPQILPSPSALFLVEDSEALKYA